MSIASDLERFILDEIVQGTGVESVDPTEDLLASGVIDSHGLMEVVAFLESRYGVAVSDDDLLPENFESLASIEAFVTRKAAA
ncbi:MAG TPA: acyl carrier protein [Thermoleophilaceae bacterium]|nr:acyl carrier protein [Thermoleophilaceae bacterium]